MSKRGTELRFKPSEVRRVVEHAMRSTEHLTLYGERIGAKVILVKDEGIYLMSSGLPVDKEGETRFVAYADGFNPTTDHRFEVYAKARKAMGGDDSSDTLDPADVLEALTCEPGDHVVHVVLFVTGKRLELASYVAKGEPPEDDNAWSGGFAKNH